MNKWYVVYTDKIVDEFSRDVSVHLIKAIFKNAGDVTIVAEPDAIMLDKWNNRHYVSPL